MLISNKVTQSPNHGASAWQDTTPLPQTKDDTGGPHVTSPQTDQFTNYVIKNITKQGDNINERQTG